MIKLGGALRQKISLLEKSPGLTTFLPPHALKSRNFSALWLTAPEIFRFFLAHTF
ncbi:hypothetical protein J4419_03025 [Candidatus Woesearchaeota archaeon]|nr:hypothetical protein [Candidatus Woesearchaeota archaeon]